MYTKDSFKSAYLFLPNLLPAHQEKEHYIQFILKNNHILFLYFKDLLYPIDYKIVSNWFHFLISETNPFAIRRKDSSFSSSQYLYTAIHSNKANADSFACLYSLTLTK